MPNEPKFLIHALKLAQLNRGYCAPNPAVGALIIDNNQNIIATGYHTGPGQAHAEIEALKQVNFNAKGCTLYVTLEPCCHFGRTPPCTDAIINSGISKVIYAYKDPNPIVKGKSKSLLQAANIQCQQIKIPEVDRFYDSYRHWTQTKTPFITAKIAMTLDGKIAKKTGNPLRITGNELQSFTHQCRNHHDAILTTNKTIQLDNPNMNVRLNGEIKSKPIYILDSQLNFNPNTKIMETAKNITLFYNQQLPLDEHLKALTNKGIQCIGINPAAIGLNLKQIIEFIGKEGIHDLWIEAGGTCFSAFCEQNLVQKVYVYLAAKWQGEGLTAFSNDFDFKAATLSWQQHGNDVLCEMNWRT